MPTKETLSSTRFLVLALLAVCATVALCLGKLSEAAWLGFVGGNLLGFSVAKIDELVKSGAAKALLPVALVGALLSGCAWQQATKTTADLVGGIASQGRAIGDTEWKARCDAKLVKCAEAKDGICEPLKQCQTDRRTFYVTLRAIQTARVGAYTAILAGDKQKAEGWAAALKEAGDKVYQTLRAWKVLP